VRPQKITFGPIGGGIIPLSRAATGLVINQAREEELLIGEGIENSLSASLNYPDLRCWAGISVGNLEAIDLPPRFTYVKLIRDRDGNNQGVHATRVRMITTWQEEGRSVTFLDPPLGFKDVNDWWRSKLAHGRNIADAA
jgi:hypothetical protein